MKTKFGTATINNYGYYQIKSRKEGNHGKFLHRLIWEDFWGTEIPKGYVIHHRNHNSLDNCILNLQLMKLSDHTGFHNSGENSSLYGKTGENHPMWKNYARIVKRGFNPSGEQKYSIRFNGKYIKTLTNKQKLIAWFLKEYPLEIIKIG